MAKALTSLRSGGERLQRAASVIRAGEDPEGTHELRVTCRRLRVGLEGMELRVLRDDLRWVTGELGLLRDLDVLLERRGLPRGLRRWAELTRERDALPRALALLDGPRFRGLVRALACLPGPEPDRAVAIVTRHERRVRRAARRFEAAEPLPSRGGAGTPDLLELRESAALLRAHALRRRLRKLRYAREWAGLDTASLAEAQDRFGVLSDESLLMRCALRWASEGGAPSRAFQAGIRRRVRAAVEEARTGWGAVDEHTPA